MYDSEATTRGVKVAVKVSYVAEQSQPLEGRWFFAYRIRIHNRGQVSVQLLNRHWVITDTNGKVQEVRGQGVVGEQGCLDILQGVWIVRYRREHRDHQGLELVQ